MPERGQIILIIGGSPADRTTLRHHLSQNDDQAVELIEVASGNQGLAACLTYQPDCILLAAQLPDMAVLEFLAALQTQNEQPAGPVIILTGVEDEAVGLQALRHGAQDYLLQSDNSAKNLRQILSKAAERAALLNERKQVEARLRLTVDTAQMGYWEWNPDTNTVTCDKYYEQLFGLAPDSFGGTYEAFLNLIHPDDRDPMQQMIQQALAEKTDLSDEFRVVWPTGEVRWLACKSRLLRNAADQVTRMVGVVRDITERKSAEAALRQSQERLQVVLRAGRMGWWERDLRTNEVSWSDSFFDLLGQSPKGHRPSYELFLERVFPGDRQKIINKVNQTIAERSEYSLEYRLLHPNGGVRWVIEKGKVFYDSAYKPQRLVGVALDITQRKWVEEGLRESEATLRSFYDNAPLLMGLVETGEDDILHLYDNPASHRFLGVATNESTTGRWTSQLGMPPAAIRELLEHFKLCKASGQPVHFEYIHQIPHGATHWLSATVSIIGPGPSGRPRFCYVAEDITKRKWAEEQQRLLAELGETMRYTEEPDELLMAVVQAVGEHLQVKRCLFTEIDMAHDRGMIRHEFCLGVPSVAGEYKISDYSQITRIDMEAGRTVVNYDAQADPRTTANYETTYKRYGERAYVAVPLRREGQWVSALWVSTDSPRQWRTDEITLLETVAERAWLAVENARLNGATKKALEQARASEQWFRELADSLPQLVWISNSEGILDYYNRRVNEYSGVALTSEGLWRWEPLLHPDDLESTLAAWQAAATSEQPYSFEHRMGMADGSYRWHLSRAVPMRDNTGVVRWFGTATDIHDLRLAQEALREKNS